MSEGPARSLSRAEQKQRYALSRELPRALKRLAKGTSWKCSQGVLFREYNGWFVYSMSAVAILDKSVVASFSTKPMALDPLFWRICDLAANREEPLSFRFFGAWTCHVPPVAKLEMPGDLATAEDIARRMLNWADAQLDRFGPDLTVEGFLTFLCDHPRHSSEGAYLDTVLTTLILMGNEEAARNLCTEANVRKWRSGFMDNTGSFIGMALRWLDDQDRKRTIH